MDLKIQMVDLKGQYEKIKTEIDAGISEVINNTQFIKGPQIKVFEENLANYLGVNHVIACANGTDALQIAMMALDLKPGDEVILPVFTYVATAEVIALLGLVPVMVDVEPDTFCINTELIEAKISDRTKAIVPVHLFGQCANMDEVMRIAQKHNLFVIEDTAQAIGAKWFPSTGSGTNVAPNDNLDSMNPKDRPLSLSDEKSGKNEQNDRPLSLSKGAGCIGNIGTTSFFPSKNLGCFGDGGALMTNDDDLAKKLRMICNHGQSVQYVHDIIGVNSRLDSLQAAILNVKLQHLKEYEEARNQAADCYDELLGDHPNIEIPKRNKQSTHVFHQYTIKLDPKVPSFRDSVRNAMKERGIPTMVYYPIELHKQKAFASDRYNDGDFPVSEQLCSTVLSLPMHTEMTREMLEYICKNLISVIDEIVS